VGAGPHLRAALREFAETQGDSLEDMWQRLAAALNAELEP
jgi:hypothetical protein